MAVIEVTSDYVIARVGERPLSSTSASPVMGV